MKKKTTTKSSLKPKTRSTVKPIGTRAAPQVKVKPRAIKQSATTSDWQAIAEQHAAELAIINSVQAGLASKLDMQSIYELIGDKVRDIFDAQVVGINTFDADRPGIEILNYSCEKGKRFYPKPRRYDQIRQNLIQTQQSIVLNHITQELIDQARGQVVDGTELSKSAIFVPMVVGQDVRGYVSIQNIDRYEAFADSDVRLLTTLVNSMSVALENARLFDETQHLLKETKQRARQISVLNQIAQAISMQLAQVHLNTDIISSVLTQVFELIGQIVDNRNLYIAIYDETQNLLSFPIYTIDGQHVQRPDRAFGSGLTDYIIRTAEPLLIPHDAEIEIQKLGIVPSGRVAKCWLGVPLMLGEKAIGVLCVQDYERADVYSPSDVELLLSISAQIAAAIENVRQFGEAQRQAREMTALNHVADAVNSVMDTQTILEIATHEIVAALNVRSSGIALLNTTRTELKVVAFTSRADEPSLVGMVIPVEGNIATQQAIETRQSVVITDMPTSSLQDEATQAQHRTRGIQCLLITPIIVRGQVIGTFGADSDETNRGFSPEIVRLSETIASHIAGAVENARLFEETQSAREVADTLRAANVALTQSLEPNSIFEALLDYLQRLIPYDSAAIFLMEGETQLVAQAVRGYERFTDPALVRAVRIERHTNSRIDQLLAEQTSRIIPDTTEDSTWIRVEATAYIRNWLASPLVIGGQAIGMFSLDKATPNFFTDEHRRQAEALAAQAAIAIQNARLFNETQRLLKETDKRAHELAIINTVQMALASKLDFLGVIYAVGDKIRDIFPKENVLIGLIDHEHNMLRLPYIYDTSKGRRVSGEFPLGQGLFYTIFTTRQPLLINTDFTRRSKELGSIMVAAYENEALTKSCLGIPIIVGEAVIGGIIFQNSDHENAYLESDVRLLQTLANAMSAALENARLFDETQRLLKITEARAAELAIINSVQAGLASKLDMQSKYDLVGDKLRDIFDAQVVDIVTYDLTTALLTWRYYIEKGERFSVEPHLLSGIRQHVIDTRQLLLINQGVARVAAQYGNPIVAGAASKSVLFMPMLIGGEAKGVISLQNLDRENAFSDSDVGLLTTLANSMSAALENARLFDETQRLLKETEERIAELAFINSVQIALAAKLDMQAIYDAVGDKIQEIFDAQVVDIVMYDPAALLLSWRYYIERGERYYPEQRPLIGFRQHAIKTRQPLVINQDYDSVAAKYGNPISIVGEAPKSVLFVPMIVGGEAQGVISLQNLDRENVFSGSDVSLLTTLANAMSVALENARLFDEVQKRNQEITEALEQQTATSEILRVIASSPDDVQPVFDVIVQYAAQLCGTKNSTAYRTDGEILYMVAANDFTEEGQAEMRRSYPRPLDRTGGLSALTILDRAIYHVPDVENDPRVPELTKRFIRVNNVQSVLFVPMLKDGIAIGAIGVGKPKLEPFTDKQIGLLQTFADQAVIAIENVRLFTETQRLLKVTKDRAAELATINTVSLALSGETTLDNIIQLVGEQMRIVFAADIVYVALLDETTDLINFPYSYGEQFDQLQLGEGLASKVIETRQPLLINQDINQRRAAIGVKLVGTEVKSYLGVPIAIGHKAIGVISVQSTQVEGRFNNNDLRLLKTMAANVASAIHNAELFAEVQQARRAANAEQKKSERLLLNVLPQDIALILKNEERVIADHFPSVSILFADVVSFTPMSAQMTPTELVELLNEVFSYFDELVEKYGLEKIKTIGDCYMVAAGVPRLRSDHAQVLTSLALDIRDYVGQHEFRGKQLTFRIGLNSGPVVAGVIGHKKFAYDLWGDAVNTASRMESHGTGGAIQITEATYDLIKDDFICEPHGVVSVKGKGEMNVWYVLSSKV
jgi:GAF domain-containing protein